jgi:class 3 adenylate cyclase
VGALPTGTVTFLLTDVPGSTGLWEEDAEAMAAAMARHDGIFDVAVQRGDGRAVRPRGEGDSRFAVFVLPANALAAAAELVRAVATQDWPTPRPIQVRAAFHTGEAELRAGDYYGSAVNRTARLRAIAHPNQVLVSHLTATAVAGRLPPELQLRDLGVHRLKDLTEPEHVFQLVAPGLEAEFPALLSLHQIRDNLPHQLDEFVGREDELAELGGLLGQHRLVTVTGPTGIGKTRLALQLASEKVDEYADGVWLVELAGVTEASHVPDAVATALPILVGAGRSPADAVGRFLQKRHVLVVADGADAVASGVASIARWLLECAPGVTLLVTSRQPLGIAGEHVWPLGALDHPDRSNVPPVDELVRYEAVRLFLDRARAVRPDFAMDHENASAVASLCAELEGIPSAIEAAAARVRALTPAQLAERFRMRAGRQ